jgi:hypothetical protein
MTEHEQAVIDAAVRVSLAEQQAMLHATEPMRAETRASLLIAVRDCCVAVTALENAQTLPTPTITAAEREVLLAAFFMRMAIAADCEVSAACIALTDAVEKLALATVGDVLH